MTSLLDSAFLANGFSYQGNLDRYPLEADVDMLISIPNKTFSNGTDAVSQGYLVILSGLLLVMKAPF
jgi:hypothetical protein